VLLKDAWAKMPKRFGIFVDNAFCERKMPVFPAEYFAGLYLLPELASR